MTEKTFALIAFAIVAMISAVGGGYATYNYMSKSYYEVHESNVGGFIFKKGKAYSLEEIKGF